MNDRQKYSTITKLQIKTLFIFRMIELKLGFPPTLREMQAVVKVSYKSISDRYQGLVKKGLMVSKFNIARGYKITDFGTDLMQDYGYDPKTDTLYENRFHRDLAYTGEENE